VKECFNVAFASLKGAHIDEHFGQARRYYVYNVCKDSFTFVKKQDALDEIEDEAGRLQYKIAQLKGVSLVVMTQIGPKASLLLKHEGINSMTAKEGTSIEDFLEKLQTMIANESKPLWLKQILLKD
jgi:nitrogen fixation protein NifX